MDVLVLSVVVVAVTVSVWFCWVSSVEEWAVTCSERCDWLVLASPLPVQVVSEWLVPVVVTDWGSFVVEPSVSASTNWSPLNLYLPEASPLFWEPTRARA